MIERVRTALGRPADAAWSAPGRVNLIGEHTDYNDGLVLPFAIGRSLTVAAARRADDEVRFHSLDREGDDPSWLTYPRAVEKLVRSEGLDVSGADVVIASDIPIGAGLSSSAALEVGVALTLSTLAGAEPDPFRVAALCRRAEEEIVGVPTGIMDQLACLLGRAGHALLIDTRSLETEAIPLPLEDAGLRILVVDTAVPRSLRASGYGDRRRECAEAARALGLSSLRDASALDVESASLDETLLRRARHVVSENQRVVEVAALLREGRLDEVGAFLTASHASLRDDFEVSTPELDAAVFCALQAGALGARMIGGGFGGSAIALCRSLDEPTVTRAIQDGFDDAGFRPPRIFDVQPSNGATSIL